MLKFTLALVVLHFVLTIRLTTPSAYIEWCEEASERRRYTLGQCSQYPFVYPYPDCYCLNGIALVKVAYDSRRIREINFGKNGCFSHKSLGAPNRTIELLSVEFQENDTLVGFDKTSEDGGQNFEFIKVPSGTTPLEFPNNTLVIYNGELYDTDEDYNDKPLYCIQKNSNKDTHQQVRYYQLNPDTYIWLNETCDGGNFIDLELISAGKLLTADNQKCIPKCGEYDPNAPIRVPSRMSGFIDYSNSDEFGLEKSCRPIPNHLIDIHKDLNERILRHSIERSFYDQQSYKMDYKPSYSFKIMELLSKITSKFCRHARIPGNFFEQALDYFKVAHEGRGFYFSEDFTFSDYNSISRMLRRCLFYMNETIQFTSEGCGVTHNIKTVYRDSPIVDGKEVHPSATHQYFDHHVVLDIPWNMLDLANVVCVNAFSKSYRMYHIMEQGIEKLFTTELRSFWLYPDVPIFYYENLYGPHWRSFARNLEKCVDSAYLLNTKMARLIRPQWIPGNQRNSRRRGTIVDPVCERRRSDLELISQNYEIYCAGPTIKPVSPGYGENGNPSTSTSPIDRPTESTTTSGEYVQNKPTDFPVAEVSADRSDNAGNKPGDHTNLVLPTKPPAVHGERNIFLDFPKKFSVQGASGENIFLDFPKKVSVQGASGDNIFLDFPKKVSVQGASRENKFLDFPKKFPVQGASGENVFLDFPKKFSVQGASRENIFLDFPNKFPAQGGGNSAFSITVPDASAEGSVPILDLQNSNEDGDQINRPDVDLGNYSPPSRSINSGKLNEGGSIVFTVLNTTNGVNNPTYQSSFDIASGALNAHKSVEGKEGGEILGSTPLMDSLGSNEAADVRVKHSSRDENTANSIPQMLKLKSIEGIRNYDVHDSTEKLQNFKVSHFPQNLIKGGAAGYLNGGKKQGTTTAVIGSDASGNDGRESTENSGLDKNSTTVESTSPNNNPDGDGVADYFDNLSTLRDFSTDKDVDDTTDLPSHGNHRIYLKWPEDNGYSGETNNQVYAKWQNDGGGRIQRQITQDTKSNSFSQSTDVRATALLDSIPPFPNKELTGVRDDGNIRPNSYQQSVNPYSRNYFDPTLDLYPLENPYFVQEAGNGFNDYDADEKLLPYKRTAEPELYHSNLDRARSSGQWSTHQVDNLPWTRKPSISNAANFNWPNLNPLSSNPDRGRSAPLLETDFPILHYPDYDPPKLDNEPRPTSSPPTLLPSPKKHVFINWNSKNGHTASNHATTPKSYHDIADRKPSIKPHRDNDHVFLNWKAHNNPNPSIVPPSSHPSKTKDVFIESPQTKPNLNIFVDWKPQNNEPMIMPPPVTDQAKNMFLNWIETNQDITTTKSSQPLAGNDIFLNWKPENVFMESKPSIPINEKASYNDKKRDNTERLGRDIKDFINIDYVDDPTVPGSNMYQETTAPAQTKTAHRVRELQPSPSVTIEFKSRGNNFQEDQKASGKQILTVPNGRNKNDSSRLRFPKNSVLLGTFIPQEIQMKCPIEHTFASVPNNCTHFYTCISDSDSEEKLLIFLQCGPATHFDPELQGCVQRGCSQRAYTGIDENLEYQNSAVKIQTGRADEYNANCTTSHKLLAFHGDCRQYLVCSNIYGDWYAHKYQCPENTHFIPSLGCVEGSCL